MITFNITEVFDEDGSTTIELSFDLPPDGLTANIHIDISINETLGTGMQYVLAVQRLITQDLL